MPLCSEGRREEETGRGTESTQEEGGTLTNIERVRKEESERGSPRWGAQAGNSLKRRREKTRQQKRHSGEENEGLE